MKITRLPVGQRSDGTNDYRALWVKAAAENLRLQRELSEANALLLEYITRWQTLLADADEQWSRHEEQR